MSGMIKHVKALEKLSLLTCSKEVLLLLERALRNVEPITQVDTKGLKPLLWQNELNLTRLHEDNPEITLDVKALRQNTAGFYEDYIAVGSPPKKQ